MARGPSILIASNRILSSAESFFNWLTSAANSSTVSLPIFVFPSLDRVIVCNTALSAKADRSKTGSAFLIPANKVFTTFLTESSAVCAKPGLKKSTDVNNTKKPFILTRFK